MIGLVLNEHDLPIAEEFFELFKTPWEPAIPRRRYSVVLSTTGCCENLDADLFLVYASSHGLVDRKTGTAVEQSNGPANVSWRESTFPIYGRIAAFQTSHHGSAALTSGGKAAEYRHRDGKRTIWRIGYDLFEEIRYLLTLGQPAQQASTPTLELHIELLRHFLLESGVTFLEVPPRPDRYDFVCCLTHDVDFFGIRRHMFDRTLAGFIGRASLKTLADLIRGRRPIGQAAQNWVALLMLPLVFLGLAPDFWHPFDDYARVEEGSRSTFFLVPFKGRPGIGPDGTVNAVRAVSYDVSEIQAEMRKAAGRGSELAVHGIDAWRDSEAGRAEMKALTSVTGRQTAGVRMHWLYYDADSPRRLEAAGYDYDSTWGYNEAVGYRPGTSQVFRLSESAGLLELPLSIMDSALFYGSRMNRSQTEAMEDCKQIIANARHLGGTLVINWHDRSLAPERLWGGFYEHLLEEVGRDDRAWFATAAEAVDWFRWRRSIRFNCDTKSGVITVTAPRATHKTPAGRLQVFRHGGTSIASRDEVRFDGGTPIGLEL